MTPNDSDHYLPIDQTEQREALIALIGYEEYLHLVTLQGIAGERGQVADRPELIGEIGDHDALHRQAVKVAHDQWGRPLISRGLAPTNSGEAASVLISAQHVPVPTAFIWPHGWEAGLHAALTQGGIFDTNLWRNLSQRRDWGISFHLDWFIRDLEYALGDIRTMEAQILDYFTAHLTLYGSRYAGCISIPIYGDFSASTLTITICVEANIA